MMREENMYLDSKLSKNFSVREYLKSATAARNGIDNSEGFDEIKFEAAKNLFETSVQPARDHFGTMVVTSGYRSPTLNSKVGGSTNSQHCKAEAVDVEAYSCSTLELAQWLSDNVTFDQLILECYDPSDPNSGWVHISCKLNAEENREQMLVYSGGYYTEVDEFE